MTDYLQKQNAALLKTLTSLAAKNNDALLQLCLEQQKQILQLYKNQTTLAERDRILERRIAQLEHRLEVKYESRQDS